MKRWLFLIFLGAVGALVLRGCLIEGIVIATGSMEPTLPVGYHAFVNKFVYRLHPPKHGDIVVFPSPVSDEKDLVKRVIAVGGDMVEVRNKQVLLNDRALVEPYVQFTRPDEVLKGDRIEPLVVPRDRVFVLGDNRDESGDSRDWVDPKTERHIYFISVDDIKGRLIDVR